MATKRKDSSYKWLYMAGIGFGIILITAFISSQILYPLFLGRSKSVEVPKVTGLSLASAKRILTEKKLHAVVTDSLWSEEIRVEEVMQQKPVEGEKMKPDGTVYLVISKGSKVVKMPSVLGMTYQQAYMLLRDLGLRSAVADSLYSDSYPVNTIVRSSPSEGLKVDKNTNVKLYLSRGPDPTWVEPSYEETNYSY